MRPSNKRLLFISFIVLFAALTSLYYNAPSSTYETLVAPDNARRFTAPPEEIEHLPEKFNPHLIDPFGLAIHDGNVYILDYGDHKIKRFDRNGNFLASIGEGKGQAPGQIQQMGIFDVHNDTVWIADDWGRTVLSFDTTGKHLDSFKIRHNANGIVALETRLIIMSFGKDLFREYRRNGALVTSFGQVISSQVRDLLSVDGKIAADPGRTSHVFSPTYASYLYRIENGEIVQAVKTIDGQDYPRSEQIGNNMVRPPSPPIKYRDLSIHNGIVYVLTQFMANDEPKSNFTILDKYALDDFEYVESIKIPHQTHFAKVYENKLYTMSHSTFAIYNMD